MHAFVVLPCPSRPVCHYGGRKIMHNTAEARNPIARGIAWCAAVLAIWAVVLMVSLPAGAQLCGDSMVDAGEQCDPPGSISCPPNSPGGAFLECQADCGCPSDHFQCYRVKRFQRPPPRTLSLADQFGSVSGAILDQTRFCNPVDKIVGTTSSGIDNPTGHLMCYKLGPTPFIPRNVVVRNQFGQNQPLTVRKRDSLCVIAAKDGVPLDPMSASFLDNFACYKVKGAQISQAVTLTDQFGTVSSTAKTPRLLCNPVDKEHEGINRPANHLVCYRLTGTPKFSRDITVEDQIVGQDLRAKRGTCSKRALVCVPSVKSPSGAFLDVEEDAADGLF